MGVPSMVVNCSKSELPVNEPATWLPFRWVWAQCREARCHCFCAACLPDTSSAGSQHHTTLLGGLKTLRGVTLPLHLASPQGPLGWHFVVGSLTWSGTGGVL